MMRLQMREELSDSVVQKVFDEALALLQAYVNRDASAADNIEQYMKNAGAPG